ncbi:MAG: hypothetical protein A3H35_07220 [Betaproteobacteria bacterium RIFCSPLOWO2_02_FULL_62_17]|nr:MAG: hypothetical protein A3H35_07220 [Betaproteobacteria bacterium RIFCSPLOWO2_02_FULL_62_17]
MAQPSTAPTPGIDWPLADEVLPSHWLSRLVYYARLAPSTHNTQPWKFVIGRRTIDVIADEARWLRVADPHRRELYVSLGCAIESLRIAADFAGYATDVSYFPIPQDATLVARVEVDGSGSKRDGALPYLLPRAVTRRTSHRKFDPAQAVTDEDRRAIYTCFDSPDIALHFITERASLDRLADLELLADRNLFADDAYRSELAVAVGEGFLGTSWLVSKLGQLAISTLPVGRQVAQSDAQRVASAPLAALLSSRHDQPLDQVHTGEAYMRIALAAESRQLRMQPVSQVLELPEIRVQVAEAAGLDDRYAQHLFRLGHAKAETEARRRRPLKDMVLRADL